MRALDSVSVAAGPRHLVKWSQSADARDAVGTSAIVLWSAERAFVPGPASLHRRGKLSDHLGRVDRCTVTSGRCFKSGTSAVPRPGPVIGYASPRSIRGNSVTSSLYQPV